MVDAELVRREFYSRGCGGLGLAGCGDRRWHREVRSAVHVDIPRHTRGPRARFGHAQAIVRYGEPVQFSMVG